MIKKSQIIFVAVFFFQSFSQAAVFERLRNDSYVPNKCQDVMFADFPNPRDIEFFTLSIEGSMDRGFEKELPYKRGEITLLWQKIKSHIHARLDENATYIKGNHFLNEAFKTMMRYKDDMDFDFNDEGQVLEVLAVVALQEEMDEIANGKYYVSGSVEYNDLVTHRTIGELDVVIAEKETCKVVSVGEVKAGKRSSGKAHQQVRRFKGFLNRNGVN